MRRTILVSIVLVLVAGGCTLSENEHYRIDVAPWGSVHAHIYRRPSYQLAVVHRSWCRSDPRCTINWLDVTIDPPWFAAFVWNGARGKPQELAAAIDQVELSGFRRCVQLYSVWTTGWSVSDPPECRLGEFVRL